MSVIINEPPRGLRKILAFHWPLLLAVTLLVGLGLAMLYAVANGDPSRWVYDQASRFALGLIVIFFIAFTPPALWRIGSVFGYVIVVLMLVYTLINGVEVNGSERWIDFAGQRLQASEFMKLALVAVLAAYYSIVPRAKISRPLYLIPPIILTLIPAALVFMQPDLGTTLFILLIGAAMMFFAGVNIWYFLVGVIAFVGVLFAVFESRGQDWQLLNDYQYSRIDVFLDPTLDPRGKGYQILQSKIALGSGGRDGQGYMQGSQSRLNFLPENHTDFIFTSYAESFGFVGTLFLLGLFAFVTFAIGLSALRNRDRFGMLVTLGVGTIFFLFYMVNMAMVMGIAPVVGLSLPFVSYGGSTMLILCAAIGLVQNAHINRPRGRARARL